MISATKTGNYRWFICFMLFAATTINYLDRQILGLLKPGLEKTFDWTETDYSHIVMAFTACYALGQLLYGKVIDKIGTKLGYTISVTVWSIAAMLHMQPSLIWRNDLDCSLHSMFRIGVPYLKACWKTSRRPLTWLLRRLHISMPVWAMHKDHR